MLITDHINLFPDNPLRGKNIEEFGPRFPDMSEPYSKKLISLAKTCAEKVNVPVVEGVYAGTSGPTFETPAEYKFMQAIGADAVGMSTVPEVIVANHLGLKVAAVSVLTDECDPDNLKAVDISEIIAMAAIAEPRMIQLFKSLINTL